MRPQLETVATDKRHPLTCICVFFKEKSSNILRKPRRHKDGQATSPERTYADEGLVGALDLTVVGDGYAVLVDHAPFVRIYQGECRKALEQMITAKLKLQQIQLFEFTKYY